MNACSINLAYDRMTTSPRGPAVSWRRSTAYLMAQDSDRGAFSADIPEEAVAEALAAVERRAAGQPEPAAADAAPPAGGEFGPGDGLLVERLRGDLARAEEHARDLSQRLDAEHERLLRAAADLENQRKRVAREREEAQRYGNERLVKEILPALDALDRALRTAPQDDPMVRGVELTRRLLEEALARFGVKGFSSRGQHFDPRIHEALMTVATGDQPPGMVVEEQQRGFFLHDRLVRPAAVVVSAAPGAREPAAGEGEASPEDDA